VGDGEIGDIGLGKNEQFGGRNYPSWLKRKKKGGGSEGIKGELEMG